MYFYKVYFFRFFKLILQLISRYYSWGENANRKSKTDIKDFGSRIKFLEDLESDLKAFYFKLNDIFSMFHQTLPKNILADVLEEQKSKYLKTYKITIVYTYLCLKFFLYIYI